MAAELNIDTPHGTRILPHLYRVAWWGMAGAGVIDCDVYAVDAGEQVVLIDAGLGGPSYPMLRENLRHWGLLDRVTTCLVTHIHPDHVGGVAQLQADGVRVWAGPRAGEYPHDDQAVQWYARFGRLPRIDRVLADSETVRLGGAAFEALATPGHTGTCMTYLATIDDVRCAFTGDIIQPDGQTGYAGTFDFDADALLASLDKLAARNIDALLTGHWRAMTNAKSYVLATLANGRAGAWALDRAPRGTGRD